MAAYGLSLWNVVNTRWPWSSHFPAQLLNPSGIDATSAGPVRCFETAASSNGSTTFDVSHLDAVVRQIIGITRSPMIADFFLTLRLSTSLLLGAGAFNELHGHWSVSLRTGVDRAGLADNLLTEAAVEHRNHLLFYKLQDD